MRCFWLLTDRYKIQVHARYVNVWALWSEVYITSALPPETLYNLMVLPERRTTDTIEQMMRRITDITYCYKFGNDFRQCTIPAKEYHGIAALHTKLCPADEVLPFP